METFVVRLVWRNVAHREYARAVMAAAPRPD